MALSVETVGYSFQILLGTALLSLVYLSVTETTPPGSAWYLEGISLWLGGGLGFLCVGVGVDGLRGVFR